MLGKGFGQIRPTNFTFEEQKTMLSLWCLFGSPLMIGSELPAMDKKTMSLLTNKEILAMEDPAFVPHQIRKNGEEAVWTAVSKEADHYYVALFNLSDTPKCILWDDKAGGRFTELWSGKCFNDQEEISKTKIPSHGCLVIRVDQK